MSFQELIRQIPKMKEEAQKQAENIEKILEIVEKNNILIRDIHKKIDFIHTECCRKKAKRIE